MFPFVPSAAASKHCERAGCAPGAACPAYPLRQRNFCSPPPLRGRAAWAGHGGSSSSPPRRRRLTQDGHLFRSRRSKGAWANLLAPSGPGFFWSSSRAVKARRIWSTIRTDPSSNCRSIGTPGMARASEAHDASSARFSAMLMVGWRRTSSGCPNGTPSEAALPATSGEISNPVVISILRNQCLPAVSREARPQTDYWPRPPCVLARFPG